MQTRKKSAYHKRTESLHIYGIGMPILLTYDRDICVSVVSYAAGSVRKQN